ncbi:MAG: hypothetical protein H0X64_14265 [Gemmatimonadaceae bacterium]|nr:hypothetical protein [Gemmatimonadaceae bacterium]
MSAAARPIQPTAREAELVAEARRIVGGRTLLITTDAHLLACLVTMDDALDASRLATEALEARDRDVAEALEQLTTERRRRIDLEGEIEALDKMVGLLLMDASQLSNRVTAAKRMVASPLYPQPAGSGAGD